MSKPSLHIVAACTDRKRYKPAPAAFVRELPRGGSLRSTVSEWSRRLQSAGTEVVPARDLYAGEHWAQVVQLPALAESYDPHLWVASAGYGLIPAESKIVAYGATFAPGSPDSIRRLDCGSPKGDDLLQAWWAELASKRLTGVSAPRTISEVVQEDKTATIMIVAGPRYVTAMLPDILDALRNNEADRLIVVTSPSPKLVATLGDSLIPSTAKLQTEVGGTRGALHARVAARILATHSTLRASRLRVEYLSRVNELPPLSRVERSPMRDAEVRAFIRRQFQKIPGQRHSPMLRVLRDDEKRACEQSRFRKLYEEVRQEEIHG